MVFWGWNPILSRVASILNVPLLSLHSASLRESNLARLSWALVLKWWALPQELWRALGPRSTPRASLRDFSSRAAKGKTAFVDATQATTGRWRPGLLLLCSRVRPGLRTPLSPAQWPWDAAIHKPWNRSPSSSSALLAQHSYPEPGETPNQVGGKGKIYIPVDSDMIT